MSVNAELRTPLPVAADFQTTMQQTLAVFPRVVELVDTVVGSGLRSVYLLGCGASNYAAWPVHHLLERRAGGLAVSRMTSAEFSCAPPSRVGPDTLVVACTHSGGTAETVAAARRAKEAHATVVGMTSVGDSELAEVSDAVLTYPRTRTIVEARQVMFAQLGYALLERLGVPDDYAAVREAFLALPAALHVAKEEVDLLAWQLATRFADEPLIYVLGAGPNYGAAEALASSYLQEMQWMHAVALNAGDFFHGPVEIIGALTPIVVLHGEDESRPVSERALSFAGRVSDKTVAIDSRMFSLPGVPSEARPKISPIVVSSIARRLLDYFAAVRGHDTSQRRYMGTVAM